jgi:DNA mismatch repair protein MutL
MTKHCNCKVKYLPTVNYYSTGFTLTSGNKKFIKYTKRTSLFNRLCEIEEQLPRSSLEVNKEEGSITLMECICKPTINCGKSTVVYTIVNGRPIKDNLLIGAIRFVYQEVYSK